LPATLIAARLARTKPECMELLRIFVAGLLSLVVMNSMMPVRADTEREEPSMERFTHPDDFVPVEESVTRLLAGTESQRSDRPCAESANSRLRIAKASRSSAVARYEAYR
jgi:hypothetical protein